MWTYLRSNIRIGSSIIFVSNETNSTKQDWAMSTNTRVELTFVNQTYQITLLLAVELDNTNVTKPVTFHVLPVNEYPPEVVAVPDILITEGNVTLPYFLAGLLDYFKDRDCPREHLVLSITKYSSTESVYQEFYKEESSSNGGSLHQLRNLINRRNVSGAEQVTKDFR
uniref:Uncharacterized protein n=1 Tax=Magallana gigas TaxID=29159 RepID=K1RJE7_MAGGI